MTPSSGVALCGAATVFVVQDVIRSVEHYRDVLGFQTELPTALKARGARTLNEPKATRTVCATSTSMTSTARRWSRPTDSSCDAGAMKTTESWSGCGAIRRSGADAP